MNTPSTHFSASRFAFLLTLACVLTGSLLGTPELRASEPEFERQHLDEIEIGYGVTIGHVDDDGKIDILLADKREIVWYRNPGKAGLEWTKHVFARNLTPRDNVCLAARDIDGDGLVEIAVGANWNPGETGNPEVSGTCFYLQRPADPTMPWNAVPLGPHEPTTHRMHWLRTGAGKMLLAVLPLHGVDNKAGKGRDVQVSLFEIVNGEPKPAGKIDTGMHASHNFTLITDSEVFGDQEVMLVAGAEGYVALPASGEAIEVVSGPLSKGAGEVRRYPVADRVFVGIEPMHGTDLVMYSHPSEDGWTKDVLDTSLNQGHALAAADLFGDATPEVVAGWRGPDAGKRVGIRLYQKSPAGWKSHLLDDNQIACEDLKLADLDGDGRLDVIAAGRATRNLVVYWNKSE